MNNYEGGDIKMVDIESMIKSLCLTWLKRIFGNNSDHTALNPSFKIDCGIFDVTKKKSKDY